MATNKNVEFEPVATRCCGLDVHKVEIVATVEGEGIKRETRTFKSTTRSLTTQKKETMATCLSPLFRFVSVRVL